MDLFVSADWLKFENNLGYGTLAIPQPRDTDITKLLQDWVKLDKSVRKKAAQKILEEQRFTLLAYSERMASLAVRERNQDMITFGLLALGIDGWRGDWRDNAVIISLHYDAAQRLNINPKEIFEKVAALLPEKPAAALRSFLHRSVDDRTLEAMGYSAGSDADGFRYKRTW